MSRNNPVDGIHILKCKFCYRDILDGEIYFMPEGELPVCMYCLDKVTPSLPLVNKEVSTNEEI